MIAGDREEVDLDRDEPCMEGSDDQFSDLEDLEEDEGRSYKS